MKVSRKISSYPTGNSKLFFQNSTPNPLGALHAAGSGRNGDLNHWQRSEELTPTGDFYGLIMILPGTHGHYSDITGFQCNISDGDFVVQIPHNKCRFAPNDKGTWNEICLGFSGNIFEDLHKSGMIGIGRSVWHTDNASYWQQRFEQFLSTPRPRNELSAAREMAQFATFLLELLESSHLKNHADSINDWFQKACFMLTNDLSHKVDLHEIAAKLNMSYDSFRRLFKIRAGISPNQYRNEHKCRIACQRLESLHEKPCWVIAEYLGFYDEAHFSRTFKKWMGMTPAQYRTHKKNAHYRDNV